MVRLRYTEREGTTMIRSAALTVHAESAGIGALKMNTRRVLDACVDLVNADRPRHGMPADYAPDVTLITVDHTTLIAVVVGITGDHLAKLLATVSEDATLCDGISGFSNVHGLTGHHEAAPVFDFHGELVAG
jgi:hypothetical protein